jgi:hypothetical protein
MADPDVAVSTPTEGHLLPWPQLQGQRAVTDSRMSRSRPVSIAPHNHHSDPLRMTGRSYVDFITGADHR